jgi:hypothetical protein
VRATPRGTPELSLEHRAEQGGADSIHGRLEARTYAKSIVGWTCQQQLSPEEDEAVSYAKPA